MSGKGKSIGKSNKGFIHRRIQKDAMESLTKPSIRRCARRGGVKRIAGGPFYDIIREVFNVRLRASHDNRSLSRTVPLQTTNPHQRDKNPPHDTQPHTPHTTFNHVSHPHIPIPSHPLSGSRRKGSSRYIRVHKLSQQEDSHGYGCCACI
jgi:hypothetical protein